MFDNHMLESVQEVSITYLFFSHRHQSSVGHVVERVLDMLPNLDPYFLLIDPKKCIDHVSE